MPAHPRKPTRRSRDPHRTQTQICEAALDCFTRNGADRTTIREIAARAKVPASLVHYHFESQEALFARVFELVLGRIQQHVMLPLGDIRPAGVTARDALLAYVRSHFEWAKAHPAEFAIWMYFYYASTLSERYRALNSRVREGGRARVASLIHEGLHDGSFQLPRGADVARLSMEIQVIVTGGWVIGATENPLHRGPLYEAVESRVLALLDQV